MHFTLNHSKYAFWTHDRWVPITLLVRLSVRSQFGSKFWTWWDWMAVIVLTFMAERIVWNPSVPWPTLFCFTMVSFRSLLPTFNKSTLTCPHKHTTLITLTKICSFLYSQLIYCIKLWVWSYTYVKEIARLRLKLLYPSNNMLRKASLYTTMLWKIYRLAIYVLKHLFKSHISLYLSKKRPMPLWLL